MRVTAAVVERPGAPFVLSEIDLIGPAPGEIVIQLAAVGMCHTDLLARDDGGYLPLPGVLGHEGAGVVVEVGQKVSRVEVGDRVILGWPWCGRCGNCRSGQPKYCAKMPMMCFSGQRPAGGTAYRRDSGGVHSHFFGQSSFSTYTVAYESCAIPVPDDVPLETCAPLGCGISTGAGAVLNVLRPQAGRAVAIFGTGAVGLSAVMAARLAGCAPVIAVDVRPNRLERARSLGATEVVNAAETDPVSAVRDLTNAELHYAVECTGHPAVVRQAVEVLAMQSICVMTGSAPIGAEIVLSHRDLLRGKRLIGVLGGEGHPDSFVSDLIRLHRLGSFPYDKMIEYFDFSDIDGAATAAANGDVLKPVLRMPSAT